MSFISNVGDIIIDSCLTDEGRRRLGNGSFAPVKFALSDDEINYEEYDKDHPYGSEYFDLSILQTPIFESLTNNTATMRSKLITIPRNNLLFLPVLKLNTEYTNTKKNDVHNCFFVAANEETLGHIKYVEGTSFAHPTPFLLNPSGSGVLNGISTSETSAHIHIDEGLDTEELNPTLSLDNDLWEQNYDIILDSRFGKLASKDNVEASPSSIDDDYFASYSLSLDTDPSYVSINSSIETEDQVIQGPRGTSIYFKIRTTIDLQTNDYLFEKYGEAKFLDSSFNITAGATGDKEFYILNSTVRVVGNDTGQTLDLPIKYIKYIRTIS